ncbi:hypothetical protein K492DRAFT_175930 [Lichtheimia hyalospora FSU 10163]|nr:hypothetical protein K492DRAFT_175930 [Lichtheimia hyalospora FSU 10163]
MTSLVTAAPAPTPANSMMHSMTLATSTCISPSHTDAEMMSTTTTTTTIPQATARPVVTPSATIAGPASALPGSALHNHSNSATKDSLQFRVILKAPTAATQISDGSPTTYLNRGQSYSIHLQDMYDTDQLITSTFIIMFHEPSHRKVALNYWKFWLGQQKEPPTARVMSLDERQSMGIHNGVKGIPLRAQMETRVASAEEGGGDMYVEQSYCKIKLFRDKGAERKNKDDAKQIGRHMERVYGVDDAQQQQPIWNTYHQPKPYSEFIRLSALEDNDNTIQMEDAPLIDAQKRTTRKRSYSQHDSTIASPSTHSNNNNKTDISLYIHVKTTQHQQFHQGAPSKHHVILSEATVDELLAQLCPVLSLHYSQVSEVLWRHQRPSKDHSSNQPNKVSFPRRNSGNDGIGSHFSAALSVDDDVVAKDFVHGTVLTVEWVIKADGTVRLWLQ